MTTRRPTLLRWTEEAEAEQVCALAALEGEPQNAAALPVAMVAPCSSRPPLAMLPRFLGWLGGFEPVK